MPELGNIVTLLAAYAVVVFAIDEIGFRLRARRDGSFWGDCK